MAVIAIGMIVVMIIIQTMITVKFLCLIYAIPVIVVNLYEYINPLLGDTKPMTRRRKILLGLLMVAGVIGLMYAFLPQLWLEYLVYLFVIPVMALNVWEWTAPEVMESMDGKGKEIISTNPQNPPKNGGQVCGGR
jgi:Sec-independent protein secretion pathway component TatC